MLIIYYLAVILVLNTSRRLIFERLQDCTFKLLRQKKDECMDSSGRKYRFFYRKGVGDTTSAYKFVNKGKIFTIEEARNAQAKLCIRKLAKP
jgi:hypothetical protein